MADLFFNDEDFDWWGDRELEPATAPAVAGAPPRSLAPARTLAGDLASLRARVARGSRRSLALLALGLGLTILLAIAVRPLLGNDEQAAPATATPANEPAVTSPSAPAAAADPSPPPALEEGDRGAHVRNLQVALTALGAYEGPADGSYGATTSAAVAAFQGTRSLLVDGVAGEDTAAGLRQALVERAQEDEQVVKAGLAASVEDGRLGKQAAADARAILGQTMTAIGDLEPSRGAVLELVLHDVAAVADGFGPARTPALFTQLRVNTKRLGAAAPDISDAAVSDGTGVVYRFFPDHGYQFHPLASFAKLNTLARREDREAATRLANALVARGVRNGNALTWQYRFPFGGPGVWESGFAQATGAQALARTGALTGDSALLDAAESSFRAIPRGLTLRVAGGTSIQEYDYSPMAVLNAQLQSIVSLSEYVKLSQNEQAEAYVAGLSETTQQLIGSFDTGCWSRYSLDGNPATIGYHTYHVKLLERLARETSDPFWRETGRRWRGYLSAGGC